MKKKIIYISAILLAIFFTSCENDDVDTKNSVFDIEDLEPMNEFDIWLEKNIRANYNTRIKYKFDFVNSDFGFNLTPPTFKISSQFCQFLKFTMFECYDEAGGIKFTREAMPKEFYLVGSDGLDPATGSRTLASAAAGMAIAVYSLNENPVLTKEVIKQYVHRIHHEFAHILDQKKALTLSFGAISEEYYLGDNWTELDKIYPNYHQLGFVSDYAVASRAEDYSEVYSLYITSTDEEWEAILKAATVYNDKGAVVDSKGRDIIEQKRGIIKSYLKEDWDIDLEKIRESLLRRAIKAETLEIIEFNEFGE